jgi:hypothetical protein
MDYGMGPLLYLVLASRATESTAPAVPIDTIFTGIPGSEPLVFESLTNFLPRILRNLRPHVSAASSQLSLNSALNS